MIVGPSYNLDTREADVQRVVNMMPVVNEVAGAKSVAYLDSVPGLRSFSEAALVLPAILLEDGVSFLLTESGGKILLNTV